MKTKLLFALIFFVFVNATVYSQFDKPIITLGFGVNEPKKQMKGEAFVDQIVTVKGYNHYVTNVSEDFITNNYGTSTGLNFFGSAKINFDKYNTFRGVLSLNYNNFNTFKGDRSANTLGLIGTIGGYVDTIIVPVVYSNNFNNFGIGLGLEIAPTAFSNIISPFFGASFNFNFISAEMTKTLSAYDSLRANFSSFRMGANLNIGLEFKVTQQIGVLFGWKYDFANLLLKNTDASYTSSVQFGRDNLELNDEEGIYYSSLTQPVYSTIPFPKYAQQKHMEWWTIYGGINIYLSVPKGTPEKNKFRSY